MTEVDIHLLPSVIDFRSHPVYTTAHTLFFRFHMFIKGKIHLLIQLLREWSLFLSHGPYERAWLLLCNDCIIHEPFTSVVLINRSRSCCSSKNVVASRPTDQPEKIHGYVHISRIRGISCPFHCNKLLRTYKPGGQPKRSRLCFSLVFP